MSSSTVTAREVRSPTTSPSETSALVATSVAVSKARISIAANRDKPVSFFAILELDLDARRRQNAGSRFRPLDEDDRVVEVGLEVPPLRRRHAAKAKEVEVGHVDAALVPMTDGVRGACDCSFDAERTARTTDERRLARSELARDRHDVAGAQIRSEARSDLLRLFRRASLDQKSPSCTAGSATTGVTRAGWGGATSRPISSGSLAKSDLSTSSMRGVYNAAAG